ncbi:hypothetical protein LIER_10933 [Lithospermum erythrorhizon]|uniref:Retrotransposon gag domain-containing protein n=1 Tax=Lithospermum erythrorhizon TaxID=34254 RepID=A0AAV3PL21_LITER
MAVILQGLTGTIVTSVMQQLWEQLPQLMGEDPVEVLSVREDGKETYTRPPPVRRGNELVAGNKAATTPWCKMPSPRNPLRMQWQPYDDRAEASRVHQVYKEIDLDEDIVEFHSFHHPEIRVYCRAFPASLVGPALKWFNRLPGRCITSFEELKNWFTRKNVGRERFQTEFNLIHGANQKIAVNAFVEGLQLSKFKESLLKRQPQDRIQAPNRAYSQIDLPRGSAFSRIQGDPKKRKEVKEGKIEYLTSLKTSAGNMFLEIEDRRQLP